MFFVTSSSSFSFSCFVFTTSQTKEKMASLPPQFIGTWELDKAKSESSEEILTAQGIGWAKRKIINNSGVTMTISEADGKVHIKQETTFTTNDNVWELGVEKDIENPIVGKGKGQLNVDGDKLVLHMDGLNFFFFFFFFFLFSLFFFFFSFFFFLPIFFFHFNSPLLLTGENGRTTVIRWVEGSEMINETQYKDIKMKRYFAKK